MTRYGWPPGRLPDPLDRDDVRMAQEAQRPGLAREAVGVLAATAAAPRAAP